MLDWHAEKTYPNRAQSPKKRWRADVEDHVAHQDGNADWCMNRVGASNKSACPLSPNITGEKLGVVLQFLEFDTAVRKQAVAFPVDHANQPRYDLLGVVRVAECCHVVEGPGCHRYSKAQEDEDHDKLDHVHVLGEDVPVTERPRDRRKVQDHVEAYCHGCQLQQHGNTRCEDDPHHRLPPNESASDTKEVDILAVTFYLLIPDLIECFKSIHHWVQGDFLIELAHINLVCVGPAIPTDDRLEPSKRSSCEIKRGEFGHCL
mmetsp:Transcript_153266/g.267203  ORF Transcript_153266/g.267203 Transcript_153266/m.267203 type:complete len:261 (+) Transcript_153266:2779-3561(+)